MRNYALTRITYHIQVSRHGVIWKLTLSIPRDE